MASLIGRGARRSGDGEPRHCPPVISSARIGGMSQAAVLKARRHVDLRRQASAMCRLPAHV